MIQEYYIELNISDEDRQKGHDLAEYDIQSLVKKFENNEISHSVFTGYIWEMKLLCEELINILSDN